MPRFSKTIGFSILTLLLLSVPFLILKDFFIYFSVAPGDSPARPSQLELSAVTEAIRSNNGVRWLAIYVCALLSSIMVTSLVYTQESKRR